MQLVRGPRLSNGALDQQGFARHRLPRPNGRTRRLEPLRAEPPMPRPTALAENPSDPWAHIRVGRTPITRLITSQLIEAKAANAPA